MKNLFTHLQVAIAGQLRADEWLSAPPAVRIHTEVDGDIASAIDRGLKGAGCTVVVFIPRVSRGDGSIPGALDVVVLVGVTENPTLNRGATGTRRTAQDVSVSVLAQLMDFRPGEEWQPLVFQERVAEDSSPDLVAFALRFETSIRVSSGQETETTTAAAA